MGQSKALLPYKGMRLIDYISEQFKNAGIVDVLISGQIEGHQSIPDLIEAKGPMSGICSAILELSDFDLALFCPTDMPLLNSQTIKALITGKSEIVKFANEPLPFAVKLSEKAKNAAQHFLQQLQEKSLSIKAFQNEFETFEIQTDEDIRNCLYNVNTPIEWQKLIESDVREKY